VEKLTDIPSTYIQKISYQTSPVHSYTFSFNAQHKYFLLIRTPKFQNPKSEGPRVDT